jgi:hypothetical protein
MRSSVYLALSLFQTLSNMSCEFLISPSPLSLPSLGEVTVALGLPVTSGAEEEEEGRSASRTISAKRRRVDPHQMAPLRGRP